MTENYICQKYFRLWKNKVKRKTDENEDMVSNRLDNLIENLKKVNNIKQENNSAHRKNANKNVFKNRFTSLENTVKQQKSKIIEQEKIIQDLKLGIIRSDLFKSIENTKINIHEIFGSCSEKTKQKMPLILCEKEKEMSVATRKMPGNVRQMEERAVARAYRREIILERKRLMEETKQKILQEAMEKKRIAEEEEKKTNLIQLKEWRKQEFIRQKSRQVNKEKFLLKYNTAVDFYDNLLLKRSFYLLYNHMKQNKANHKLAVIHYEVKIKTKTFSCWLSLVEEKSERKYEIARYFYCCNILKTYFKIWKEICSENRRNMQTAEDLYDFRLTSNVFIHWHLYTNKEQRLYKRKEFLALTHYNRKILCQYFYQWRLLPEVLQLEKAKELKKIKWRSKVWEILPDYKPPEIF